MRMLGGRIRRLVSLNWIRRQVDHGLLRPVGPSMHRDTNFVYRSVDLQPESALFCRRSTCQAEASHYLETLENRRIHHRRWLHQVPPLSVGEFPNCKCLDLNRLLMIRTKELDVIADLPRTDEGRFVGQEEMYALATPTETVKEKAV